MCIQLVTGWTYCATKMYNLTREYNKKHVPVDGNALHKKASSLYEHYSKRVEQNDKKLRTNKDS